MARNYQGDHDHGNEGGFFDRIGNRVHQAWDRLSGDEEDNNRTDYRSSSYQAGAADNYSRGTRYGEGGRHSGGGPGYGESHLGRYSPQQSSGSSYGGGGAYRAQPNSSTGYSGRMSEYGSASQHDPYAGSSARDYGDASGYNTPPGEYGRSSMGFPRGTDYGSGGSGSMGGGYFGSGAGPWSGGPYSNTGDGGYTQQRNQGNTSESDYRYSRREQERRGSNDDYRDYYDR